MSLTRKILSLLIAPIFTILALGLFLSPETARAAQLAGEEVSAQAATSQPQGTPSKGPAGREEVPAKTETAQPAVLAPSRNSEATLLDSTQASPPRQTQKTAPQSRQYEKNAGPVIQITASR